jgi:hypothetical protein
MRKSIMMICVMFALSSAYATAKPFTGNSADASTTSTTPSPPPEMAALYPRIGKWSVTVRTEPGKNSPKGGMDRGIMTMTKGPGGFSVVQDYWSRGSSGHIVGQSYAWWDASAKTYKSVWCDNMQGCVEFATAISNNSWTVELDSVSNGEKVRTMIHATMSADHNSIHEETRSSVNGSPYQTEAVSDYKRIAAAGK